MLTGAFAFFFSIIALSSNASNEAKKCLATNVHGSFVKLESAVRGLRSTCIRYTCVGTCVISLIAAAVVKLTWPDVRDGYVEECGNVDVFGLAAFILAFFCLQTMPPRKGLAY